MATRKLGQIYKELAELENKAHQIKAKYEVQIFSDPMTGIGYNSRSRLRDALVTGLLADSTEYQEILKRIHEVNAEKIDTEMEAEIRELENE